MTSCKHSQLVLLAENKKSRLRCRHCHLTISPEELTEGYCPECFEIDGKKRYDFEKLEVKKSQITKYRCEKCGIIIECK